MPFYLYRAQLPAMDDADIFLSAYCCGLYRLLFRYLVLLLFALLLAVVSTCTYPFYPVVQCFYLVSVQEYHCAYVGGRWILVDPHFWRNVLNDGCLHH